MKINVASLPEEQAKELFELLSKGDVAGFKAKIDALAKEHGVSTLIDDDRPELPPELGNVVRDALLAVHYLVHTNKHREASALLCASAEMFDDSNSGILSRPREEADKFLKALAAITVERCKHEGKKHEGTLQ